MENESNNIISTTYLFWFVFYYLVVMIPLKVLRTILFKSKTIAVVLGSGGHTGEMLLMIKKLDFKKFAKVVFICSQGDITSKNKVIDNFKISQENDRYFKDSTVIEFVSIFRSRKVGQSFKSSIFTTLISFIHSVFIILKTRPSLVSNI